MVFFAFHSVVYLLFMASNQLRFLKHRSVTYWRGASTDICVSYMSQNVWVGYTLIFVVLKSLLLFLDKWCFTYEFHSMMFTNFCKLCNILNLQTNYKYQSIGLDCKGPESFDGCTYIGVFIMMTIFVNIIKYWERFMFIIKFFLLNNFLFTYL